MNANCCLDGNGACTKDYIYLGSKLLADYRTSTSGYFYYTADQINSTRTVTNGSGSVVYAGIADPFGGMQKEWTTTYNPALKFSGKEREAGCQADYFGARYYDHSKYRFLSVDPARNKDEALDNPQLWNLYSYCRNNPMTFIDIAGKESKLNIIEHRVNTSDQIPNNPNYRKGVTRPGGKGVTGRANQLADGTWHPSFDIDFTLDIYYVKGQGVKSHEFRHGSDFIAAFNFDNESLFNMQSNYSDYNFTSKEDCLKFANSIADSANNFLVSAALQSILIRDIIGLVELAHKDTYEQIFPTHD